jgi:L-rhamnose isomerase
MNIKKQEDKEYFYSVWVGGVEVNNYFLNKKEAENLAQLWIDDGYDEVAIDDYRVNEDSLCNEVTELK